MAELGPGWEREVIVVDNCSTGGVTSVGNAATVVTNANLTGNVTSVGNATTLASIPAISGANLTSLTAANISAGTAGISVTGNAATVTTNANLTGHITSSGNAAVLGSFTSAQLLTALTDETGTGANVFATSPTLVTPALGTPASGILSGCTVDGTDAVGFRNIPINSNSAAYTAVLADSGKVIFHPSTDANARTFTIPANSSVAYALGTAITFINMTSQVVTIAITTDTMYLSSAGTTGSRSLPQYGSATAIKMTSTTWLISGSGLT